MSISFSQKEIDGSPVSGLELDRYLMQTDKQTLNQNDLLYVNANGDANGLGIGANGTILKVIAGALAFQAFSSDQSLTETGHTVLDNGLILNWQTTTALAATTSLLLTHSKPFSYLNLGSFVSVVDANNVVVQPTAETLTDVTISNFDAVNAAAIVRVLSIGI